MYPTLSALLNSGPASGPMTPASSEVSTGASAFPSAELTADGTRAADRLVPAERERLVQQLRDPHHHFELEESNRLLSLIWAAEPMLRSRIDLPNIVWCEPGQSMQGPVDPGRQCLRMAPVPTDVGWELHSALTADVANVASGLPAHVGPKYRFRCPAHDVFDVIALTLENERPRETPGSTLERPQGRYAPGWPLRQVLADCLESDRAGPAPLTSRPLALHDLIPQTLRSRTLALAETLRQGGWSPELDRMAPQLLARLHPLHEGRVGKVDISLRDRNLLSLHAGERGVAAQVFCEPDMFRVHLAPCQYAEFGQTFQSPDAYLQALLQGSGGDANKAAEVRHLLADLIERHPLVSALTLAIFDRWPDRDAEVMLRFCLHGNTLQPAGRQLLETSRPARVLTAQEVMPWAWARSASRLDAEWLAKEGISVADMRWHFSPLNLSGYALSRLRQHGAGVPPLSETADQRGTELLKQHLPQLRYELGSMAALSTYLQLTPEEVMSQVGEALFEEATEYRNRMVKRSVLD